VQHAEADFQRLGDFRYGLRATPLTRRTDDQTITPAGRSPRIVDVEQTLSLE
jgi:hypothetical protein